VGEGSIFDKYTLELYNIYNLYKRYIMTITSTQLKQETYLIDNAIKEDILVTKRGRPFVVIMDAKRYEELIANQLLDKDKEPRAGWDEKFRDRD